MLTSTRRRLAAAALVLLVPSLGACGFGYQTDQIYQPGVGVNNRDDTVDVLGAVVVSTSDGRGTFVASLVNKSLEDEDTLVAVTGEDLEVQLAEPIEIGPEQLVNLAETPSVSVTGETVIPGKFARITLEFESGQTSEVHAPVVPYEDEFRDISPAAPSESPSTAP